MTALATRLDTLDLIFDAVADRTRRSILDRLQRGPMTVSALAEPYEMSLNGVSKHLKKLQRAGLIRREIRGREHYCRLDARKLRSAMDWMSHYQQFWTARLDALEQHLIEQTEGSQEMNDPKIVVRKQLPASREEVFDAWLDSEGMGIWMCPGPITSSEVAIDPRVGGHFTILMKSPTGEFDHAGEFRVLDRPSKLQFTWISAGTDREETLVTVELHERGLDCELVLTHERIPRLETVKQYEEGWGHILDKLSRHLPIRQH